MNLFDGPTDAFANIAAYNKKLKFVVDENPRSSFAEEIRSYGFKGVPAMPVVDSIERIESPSDKRGKKSGWYIYYEAPNEFQPGTFIGIGIFGSWNGEPERVVWSSKSRNTMSASETRMFDEKIKEARIEQQMELAVRQAEAASLAKEALEAAQPASSNHPYVVDKKIDPKGILQSGEKLLVPVSCPITREPTSIQFIYKDGTKLFLKGGKTRGCYCHIAGDEKKGIFVCEGYATAATIHEATGGEVYLAFSANNLPAVFDLVQKWHPRAVIYVAGDDDRWTKGNPGRTKAELIAREEAIFPEFSDYTNGNPTDFNDLHVREGLEVVRGQINSVMSRDSTLKVGRNSVKPTFDECIKVANNLCEGSSPKDINEALETAVKSNANPIETRKILASIKNQTKIPLSDLKEGLSAVAKEKSGPSSDLAHQVAKNTLNHHYAGGDYLVRAMDRGFWKYNGKHWERTTDEQVQNKILSVVENTVDPNDASFAGIVKSALSLIISMRAAEGDVLRLTEEPPSVINCQNGELWVKSDGTVELRPHKFGSYLTYVLDAKYDPNAQCPKFDQALKDIFANSTDTTDLVRHCEEFIGYAIQPRRNIASWFMLQGRGRNGKTKLVETIERLINKGAIYSDRLANVEKDKFAIGSIAGKLLLLDDDVDTGTVLPDGFMKKSSERKLMTGQLKFKDSFEFICVALIVILANNLPLSADLSYGNRRRAQIIPFARTFTDEDADDALFPYIWENEMSGILNRAIEGLGRLQQRGRFKPPLDCQAAMTNWLMQANPLVAFIDEKCAPEVGASTPGEAFYAGYQKWAETAGVRSIPSRTMTYANLENLGYEMRRCSGGRVLSGLRLNGHHYNMERE